MIDRELLRRQGGYGRGGRQKIETDKVEFLTGVRMGHTIASPVTMLIPNKDSRLSTIPRRRRHCCYIARVPDTPISPAP